MTTVSDIAHWLGVTVLLGIVVALVCAGTMALRASQNSTVMCKEQVIDGSIYANDCVRLKPRP